MVSQVRRSLLTLMAAVLAVLLVACLNLSGLMIARTMRRSRELALRSALGATRAQLVRMLACEGLVLAISGGLLALLVARASAHILLRAAPLAVPSLRGEPGLWLLSAVVLVIAMLATGTFSLLPASFILFKKDRQMRLGGPSLGETVSHARLSRALMVAQISLAMVLVSTASVLLGTFVKLRSVPSGVEPKRLSVFQVSLKGEHYANTMRTTQFVRTVLQNLKRTPGVDSVAAVNGFPLDRGLNIGGNPTDRHDIRQIIEFRSVTPGYFQTMGIPLLAGRDVAASDKAGGDLVIVVGAETARKWWPGQSAIGKSIKVGGERNWRIIGVAADTHTHSLVETGDMLIYAPIDQLSDEFSGIINGWFPTTFAVRTAANVNIAATAQQSVTLADTEIPVARLTTMQAVIDSSIQQPRFFSLLAGSFSVFALVLTIIGLFGLLSYQVTQRTREIGVRMALGADRGSILRTFLNRGFAVGLVGIAIGLAASWMMRAIVGHLLADAGIDAANGAAGVVMNGVQAAVVAALTILFSTLAASWLPARRAASIEPMQALRAE
jgi:predicted permease